jgi:hypothetical protein
MAIRFDNANQINQPGGVGIATTLGRIVGDVATGAG